MEKHSGGIQYVFQPNGNRKHLLLENFFSAIIAPYSDMEMVKKAVFIIILKV